MKGSFRTALQKTFLDPKVKILMFPVQFLRDCVHPVECVHARQDRARHHRHEGLRALQLPPPDISQVSWVLPHLSITGTTKRKLSLLQIRRYSRRVRFSILENFSKSCSF